MKAIDSAVEGIEFHVVAVQALCVRVLRVAVFAASETCGAGVERLLLRVESRVLPLKGLPFGLFVRRVHPRRARSYAVPA